MEFQSSYPPCFMPNWLAQEGNFTEWTIEDDKLFEDALAMFDENTPDRWAKIAAVLPTKTFFHAIQYYKDLEEEATKVPITPNLESSTLTEMKLIVMLEAQLQREMEHLAILEAQLQRERERNRIPALIQPVNNFHVQPLNPWNAHATVQVQSPLALQAQSLLVSQAQPTPIQPDNVAIKRRIQEAVQMAISQNQGNCQVVPPINHNDLEEEEAAKVPISPYPESSTLTEMELIAMLEAQIQRDTEHLAILEAQLQCERERNRIPALIKPVNNFHAQPLVPWNTHAINHNYDGSGKIPRSSENERKKRVPWTKEEHISFLVGLQKCGPGKWRDISHKFVRTKTPTQVASHAQKYHIRHQNLSKGEKNNKRRSSIHDITIPDILQTTTTPHDEDKAHIPFQESQMPSPQQNQTSIQEVQPNCDDMFM